jgi:Tfp pilus assembly protein PilN
MRAVNLIPDGSRRGTTSGLTASPQTLGLVGLLALALVGVLLYVSAANAVTERTTQLTQVTAAATQARSQADALARYVQLSKQHASQVAAVRQLATERFPWPRLLDQLAEQMPSGAALTSIQGSTGSAGGGRAAAAPTVQLSGCAVSHSAVARTMDRLRAVTGVTDIALASSAEAAGRGGTGVASGGTCAYPAAFQMTLTLAGVGAPAGGEAVAGTAADSTPTPSR